jgi:hypothetical protein
MHFSSVSIAGDVQHKQNLVFRTFSLAVCFKFTVQLITEPFRASVLCDTKHDR